MSIPGRCQRYTVAGEQRIKERDRTHTSGVATSTPEISTMSIPGRVPSKWFFMEQRTPVLYFKASEHACTARAHDGHSRWTPVSPHTAELCSTHHIVLLSKLINTVYVARPELRDGQHTPSTAASPLYDDTTTEIFRRHVEGGSNMSEGPKRKDARRAVLCIARGYRTGMHARGFPTPAFSNSRHLIVKALRRI
ncbi:hypothetical protein JB92DRAFT_2833127 [Gautieria morchelliformis]|nr:hypothetical protein JB92DRAFT_2833127 [Gautieria morchelliformis]